MSKEVYYFSHDYNARRDEKIITMLCDYKAEGYGLFWCCIEMMAEAEGYKLKKDKFTFNAIAMQMQCERNAISKFVEDCICEYELFKSDGVYFWSESLLNRMQIKEMKSEKAKKSAQARWKKAKEDANAEQPQSESNANALKNDANVEQGQCEVMLIKGNEMKGNEISISQEKIFSDEQIEMVLTKKLYELMLINNPKAKKPDFQKWAKNIDLMIRIDKRTPDEIKDIIEFSQQDNFWKTNILSTSKLREKFDALYLKANNSNTQIRPKEITQSSLKKNSFDFTGMENL